MKVYWEKAEIGYVGSMLTPRIAERKCFSSKVAQLGNEVSTTGGSHLRLPSSVQKTTHPLPRGGTDLTPRPPLYRLSLNWA